MLPNLIVIGAVKAGTTALHAYLGLHPEIAMSDPKEINFFTSNWARGVEWYSGHFVQDAPILGEATPSYTSYPRNPDIPARMASIVPDAKLIYLVRDPFQRALSAYTNKRLSGSESLPLAQALTAAGNRYVAGSCYGLQLERYLAYFPLERILVVESEALLNRRLPTLRSIFGFLGVDASFESPGFERLVNETRSWGTVRRPLGDRVVTGLDRALGEGAAAQLRRRAPKVLSSPLYQQAALPALKEKLRRQLAGTFREDLARLRELTGQDFASLSV